MSSYGIMDHQEFKYVALTTNGIKKKRLIVDMSLVNDPYKLPNCFRSWCRFSADIIKYQNAHKKSLRGYNGLCYSDFLPIDIDNEEHPERSLESCRELLQYLEQKYDVPIKAVRIYFSGSKGFHLEIPTILFGDIKPTLYIPRIFKNIVKSFNFNDVDTKIYHINGMWRLSNSINSKSGLYKIPLTYNDINTLTYDQICHKAQVPNKTIIWTAFDDWDSIDDLKHLWKQSIPATSHKQITHSINQSNKKYIFDFPGVVESKRNDTAFKIAHQLRGSRWKINEVKEYIVKDWNPKNNPPEKNIQSLLRTVEAAYSYNQFDSGSIGITKHLRTDPYYTSMDSEQKAIYLYFIIRLNEVPKLVFGRHRCLPNQCIFSFRKVAVNLNVGEQRVKTLIKSLIKMGRVSVETLYNNGRAECSRITFHNIDLTQYLTRQNDLSSKSKKLTHQLTATNILNNGS